MKKFDWNVPMTRKNWAWVYAISAGVCILIYAGMALWWVLDVRRIRRKREKEDLGI